MSAVPGIDTVLIANRGEIALRIARTLRRLGIRSVVAHHRVDRDSPAVRAADAGVEIEADEPLAAHLDAEQIAAAAARVGADAVHPGYGFLAENARFAEAVAKQGVRFVGPGPDAMRLLGDKIAARRFAARHGFRVAPAVLEEGDRAGFARRAAALGFPLLVKPAAGGGGKGMIRVSAEPELAAALARSRAEALRYFGDDRLYVERFVERPRHVEVQVLADRHGACVHLFERECSVQRRFQKLVEETPAPGLSDELRDALHEEAVGIARAAGYENAGTVEFVLAPDGAFTFLEMNTRLQVEHPVTELVTGVDLVEEQLRIAAGEPLRFAQSELRRTGCAVEVRICAEDADAGFLPTTGRLLHVRAPGGPGVRFDAALAPGQEVTADFDPLLAKLAAHGATREEAIARARAALAATVLLGVATNAAFLARVLGSPAFARGDLHTGFVAEHAAALAAPELDAGERRALVAAAALAHPGFLARVQAVPALPPVARRLEELMAYELRVAGAIHEVVPVYTRDGFDLAIDGRRVRAALRPPPGGAARRCSSSTARRSRSRSRAAATSSGCRSACAPSPSSSSTRSRARRARRRRAAAARRSSRRCPVSSSRSPSPRATWSPEGDLLVAIESMKLQTAFRAPHAARVVEVAVAAGASFEKGAVLVRLEAAPSREGGR